MDRAKGGIRKMGKIVTKSGVPGGIRTHDPLLRRQPLYPLSYRDRNIVTLENVTRIEAVVNKRAARSFQI